MRERSKKRKKEMLYTFPFQYNGKICIADFLTSKYNGLLAVTFINFASVPKYLNEKKNYCEFGFQKKKKKNNRKAPYS